MNSRLPRAAHETAPASLPPSGLPGLDPSFSRLVTAAGRTWHLLDTGPVLDAAGITPSATILCVHGNPTWSYLWRSLTTASVEQARAGGEAWRVIAVDQLDMGYSERTGVERDLSLRVGDLTDLTDELGLDSRVVTFGHDWGGIISLGWAVDHRDQVDAVLLLNTAVHQPDSSKIPAPLRLALGRGILGRATVSTPAFLETTLGLAHPPLPLEVKEAYRAPYRGAERRGGIGAFVADIPLDAQHASEAERRRIAEAIRELEIPALMLWGPRDPIFSDRYLDDLLDRLPTADVHRFEGAGHLIAEDVDFAQTALTWLGERVPSVRVSAASMPIPEAKPRPGSEDPDLRRVETGSSSRPLWSYLDARRDSDEVALVEMAPPGSSSPHEVSWRSLARRVDRLAAGLTFVGVNPGDRVSLLVPPGADLTAVLYACLRIGAVVVVADAGLGVAGLTRAVRGAWPHHLIGALPGLTAARGLRWPGRRISTEVLPAVASRALGVSHSLPELASIGAAKLALVPEGPAPDDLAAVLFTSGSTGPAKGVAYTHAQLAAVCAALAATYDVGPETGLVAGFAPFALLGPALGARSVTPDMDVTSPKTLTATAVAAAAARVDATVVFLSPAALANVVATSTSLSSDDRAALTGVEVFLSAGAPVSAELLEAAALLMPGAVAHTPYGMTEGLLLTDATLDEIRSADEDAPDGGGPGGVCVGRPALGVRVRISPLDETGTAAEFPEASGTGITGEIVVSAPHLFDHYDRLWLTDHVSRRGAPAGERWHRTGDVGHLDSRGRLFVEGRLPHVITTPQGVVTPVGPEQRVERLASVSRAAAVGVGPNGTQQIVLVVETSSADPRHASGRSASSRPALAEAGLAADVRRVAGVPVAAVLVVAQLPTDIRHNSKIDRTALGAWAADVLAGGDLVAPR